MLKHQLLINKKISIFFLKPTTFLQLLFHFHISLFKLKAVLLISNTLPAICVFFFLSINIGNNFISKEKMEINFFDIIV